MLVLRPHPQKMGVVNSSYLTRNNTGDCVEPLLIRNLYNTFEDLRRSSWHGNEVAWMPWLSWLPVSLSKSLWNGMRTGHGIILIPSSICQRQ